MCGIVAAIAKKPRGFVKDEVAIFTQMLVVDSLRGSDATGVWGTMPSGNVSWTKIGGNPYALFDTVEYSNWENRMQRSLDTAIGHNRYATSGGTKSEHAHPFVKDHIIMCHNGAIWNHEKLRPNAPKDSVDSEAIAHALAADDDHVKVIESLQGAYAIVWYNAKQRKTYFVHNDERPMHFMELDHVIFLMSEKRGLEFIRDRNLSDAAKWEVKEVPTDRIFCWDHVEKTMSSVKYTGYVAAKVVGYETCFPHASGPFNDGDSEYVDAEIVELKPKHTPKPADDRTTFERMARGIPLGTKVVVQPSTCVSWDIPQVDGRRIESHTTFEGVPLIYKYSGNDVAKLEELAKCKYLEGTVASHLLATDHMAIWLKDVKPQAVESTFKSFNGISVTFKEWSVIHKDVPCRKCGEHLMAQGLKLTSLQFKTKRSKWVAVCPKCTVSAYKDMTEDQRTLAEAKAGIDVEAKAKLLEIWDVKTVVPTILTKI